MSEPLSSNEIEDVLSSIRRLVSDDVRPPLRKKPATEDKLILTPSLRVVQDAPAPAPVAVAVDVPVASPVPAFVAAPRMHLSQPHVDVLDAAIGAAVAKATPAIGAVVASVGAAVSAQPDEWDAETGDVAPSADFDAEDWTLTEAGDVDAPYIHADLPESNLPEADFGEVVAFGGADRSPADGGLADRETEPEILVQADQGDQPKDMAQAGDVPGWAQDDIDSVLHDDAAPDLLNGTVEPDPVWAAAAEASVIDALKQRQGGALPQDDIDDEDEIDESMRFNEDVLRELVRDILREELAGRMGERITRNIRKLVRTELARALAMQDLD